VLFGGAGDDVLLGGGGKDRLFGRAGDDLLSVGVGSDSFEFFSGYGRDTITDFQDDRDTIVLDGASLGVTSKRTLCRMPQW
jgi:Ca2+-binding RTX toxin-like protein